MCRSQTIVRQYSPNTIFFASLLVGITTAFWMPDAHAQFGGQSAAASGGQENPVLRTYEVGDLVLDVQDHPYSETLQKQFASVSSGFGGGEGGYGGGRGGLGAVGFDSGRGRGSQQQSDNAITVQGLKHVIVSTIDPESWAENGTGEGRIEALGTALVVNQMPEVQEMIKILLNQIREGSADRQTLTIDARWLLLNSDELDELVVKEKKGINKVKPEVLARFTRKPGSIRGMTSCYSGQLVYVVSGTRKNFVTSYIPVVGSLDPPGDDIVFASWKQDARIRFVADSGRLEITQGRVGYQPVVQESNLGALLEIRPTLLSSGSSVVVDLKSTITIAAEQAAGALSKLNEGTHLAPEVDRVAIETQEFATTVRIPLSQPVLVGGLTHAPTTKPAPNEKSHGTNSENTQLYLVLEVK